MAEFQEVMRQFNRMCEAHAKCVDCPLTVKDSIETRCGIGSFRDESEYVEQEIMQWAADNPEPVYPTWVDWFRQIGVVPPEQKCFHTWLLESIPADIAQKLNIESKEG